MVVEIDLLLAGDEKESGKWKEERGKRILHRSELDVKCDRRHDAKE
jgi:hypothetical protein